MIRRTPLNNFLFNKKRSIATTLILQKQQHQHQQQQQQYKDLTNLDIIIPTSESVATILKSQESIKIHTRKSASSIFDGVQPSRNISLGFINFNILRVLWKAIDP